MPISIQLRSGAKPSPHQSLRDRRSLPYKGGERGEEVKIKNKRTLHKKFKNHFQKLRI
ncbi:hypothetical protein X927_03955 [Petrotoga mexicana DSM 14811]|uniref:Uncharacterized protein n=1 Tax=Petrotoga mexicana DSM 14811 TaxID=1122954 RepID=A0A2K1PBR7_9BACT|nr:hypothetical protein X927_03955 [Petrotoga mexicana DSM 14811]